jgi:ATPase subunit of ABC transporter with duplicated ATPase domains
MSITMELVSTEKMDKDVSLMDIMVNSVVVSDQTSYEKAAELLVTIREGKKNVIAALDPQRESAWANYQVALNQLKKYKDPYDAAEKVVNGKISDYLIEEKRKEEREQERLNELAEKEAEKQRQKLLKKAGKAKTEERKEELEEEAEMVFAVPTQVTSTVTKAEGVAHRFDTKVEIIDMLKLIKAIADGTVRVNVDKLFTAKSSVLKELVDLMGLKSIPGCKIESKPILSVSTKGGKK